MSLAVYILVALFVVALIIQGRTIHLLRLLQRVTFEAAVREHHYAHTAHRRYEVLVDSILPEDRRNEVRAEIESQIPYISLSDILAEAEEALDD